MTTTVDRSRFTTLEGINDEIAIQNTLIDNHSPGAWYTLEDAREGLRIAKEAKRIFAYKARSMLTKNGKTLRP